jgi:hypothetical protein
MVEDRGWRYELKMACDLARLAQARTWIRLHPAGFRTAFPPRTVNNLYFDTPDLNSLFANTYGVGSRQKLRLRWYGETLPTTLSHSVLELKYKDNMLGNKKTEGLDCTLDFSQTYRQIRQTIQENSSPILAAVALIGSPASPHQPVPPRVLCLARRRNSRHA